MHLEAWVVCTTRALSAHSGLCATLRSLALPATLASRLNHAPRTRVRGMGGGRRVGGPAAASRWVFSTGYQPSTGVSLVPRSQAPAWERTSREAPLRHATRPVQIRPHKQGQMITRTHYGAFANEPQYPGLMKTRFLLLSTFVAACTKESTIETGQRRVTELTHAACFTPAGVSAISRWLEHSEPRMRAENPSAPIDPGRGHSTTAGCDPYRGRFGTNARKPGVSR